MTDSDLLSGPQHMVADQRHREAKATDEFKLRVGASKTAAHTEHLLTAWNGLPLVSKDAIDHAKGVVSVLSAFHCVTTNWSKHANRVDGVKALFSAVNAAVR